MQNNIHRRISRGSQLCVQIHPNDLKLPENVWLSETGKTPENILSSFSFVFNGTQVPCGVRAFLVHDVYRHRPLQISFFLLLIFAVEIVLYIIDTLSALLLSLCLPQSLCLQKLIRFNPDEVL